MCVCVCVCMVWGGKLESSYPTTSAQSMSSTVLKAQLAPIIIFPEWTWQSLSHVWFFVTPWTVAHQAPLSMEFSRQEYWSRLPFPSPGDLPNPRIEPGSPALAGRFFIIWATREASFSEWSLGILGTQWHFLPLCLSSPPSFASRSGMSGWHWGGVYIEEGSPTPLVVVKASKSQDRSDT